MTVRPGKPTKTKRGETFLASIYRIWMLRYVDVPEAVVRALAKQTASHASAKSPPKRPKYIPVVATVNGQSSRTTLVPAGGGRYRMQFNAALRKAANADVGDAVSVAASPDRQSREITIPADLRAALHEHPKAKKAFDDAPPGYRRQMLKWMDSAKSTAARMRRIEIVMDRMLERAILGPSARAKQ